jgi:hypothetical protein
VRAAGETFAEGRQILTRCRTNRWTGAAVARFASSLIWRYLNEFAPPGQLNRSVSYLFIGMTRNQLLKIWRNLWFWQRALIECSIVVLFFLLFELILHGRAGDFGDATIEGVAIGLFYAIIDHAFLASNRKRADRRG